MLMTRTGESPPAQHWGSPTRPVVGAKVSFRGIAVSTVTNNAGIASIPGPSLPTGAQVLDVTPHPSQLSPGPAGPALGTGGAADPAFMLRPFEVQLTLDANGVVAAPAPVVPFTPTTDVPAAHAAVFGLPKPRLLLLDWKPDWVKTPNQNSLAGRAISALVLHQTAVTEVVGGHLNWFLNPHSNASAHYLVAADGHAVKLVHESKVSWHAGASFWAGRLGLNDFSVGIETAHTDRPHETPYTDEQYRTLIRLSREIRAAFGAITAERVVGHSDVEVTGRTGPKDPATGRRTGPFHFQIGTDRPGDPGRAFEWTRFEEVGIARRPAEGPPRPDAFGVTEGHPLSLPARGPNVEAVKRALSAIGYSISDRDGVTVTDVYDVALQRAVARFQTRFFVGNRRGLFTGTLGVVDQATAGALEMF